jgi:hypothetical protein
MIDHVWRERLALADCLIGLAGNSTAFKLACGLESVRRTAIDAVRAMRDAVRNRRRAGHSAQPRD